MNIVKKKVCLLYRKPGRFFSIERIFRQLTPGLSRELAVDTWIAPASGASPRALLQNCRTAASSKADIYHITGDIHYVALGLPGGKVILTIHDCIFLYSSRGIKRRLLKWLFLDMPVRRCQLITTISEATRRDILEHTNCPPGKIIVIPNPVNDHIYYTPLNFRKQEPVILFVGTTPNKNLEKAVAALENISCRLDIIGDVSPAILILLAQYRIAYSLQTGLTDEEIAAKYASSDIVLFPSLFEGFGLPVVEGQKAGRPVITSNLDPMREVAGGAACLVDPHETGSIRDGILRVIQDDEYRLQLVEAGLVNAKRFAAENITRQYLDCYRKVLSP